MDPRTSPRLGLEGADYLPTSELDLNGAPADVSSGPSGPSLSPRDGGINGWAGGMERQHIDMLNDSLRINIQEQLLRIRRLLTMTHRKMGTSLPANMNAFS